MIPSVPVKVRWVNQGRVRIRRPPRYSTIARFAEDAGKNEAWSIVLELSETASGSEILAEARFLSDDAPHGRLQSGVTFEMMEGDTVTAHVTVL